MRKKKGPTEKTKREVKCRTRSPEAEEHYKLYNRLYMRAYRARIKKLAAKKAKKK